MAKRDYGPFSRNQREILERMAAGATIRMYRYYPHTPFYYAIGQGPEEESIGSATVNLMAVRGWVTADVKEALPDNIELRITQKARDLLDAHPAPTRKDRGAG
jgi:hypothetical protein